MNRRLSETDVVAAVAGLSATRLRLLVASDCVRPREEEGHLVFREHDVARLRLACELVDDFDLDTEAAALVMSLLDQIHGLRRELRGLADAVAAEPDEVRARIRNRMPGRREGGRTG